MSPYPAYAHALLVTFGELSNERVSQLNARQNDWTVFLFRKDCDWTFALRYSGALSSAPITI
jgi:hypothetical protein